MTPLTPTEQEDLRIAIAEEIGWKRFDRSYSHPNGDKIRCIQWEDRPGHPLPLGDDAIPPCTTSIDAIREAAMERFKDDLDVQEFGDAMFNRRFELDIFTWQLTALDWCIAFARTSKIWRFK
tara:strand:+ start:120 stop:485 length:366 start_codon:yes stop_codon:yes gene_type:complete